MLSIILSLSNTVSKLLVGPAARRKHQTASKIYPPANASAIANKLILPDNEDFTSTRPRGPSSLQFQPQFAKQLQASNPVLHGGPANLQFVFHTLIHDFAITTAMIDFSTYLYHDASCTLKGGIT